MSEFVPISSLDFVPFGHTVNGVGKEIDTSEEKVKLALSSSIEETRSFQKDIESILTDINSFPNEQEVFNRLEEIHNLRIAYLIKSNAYKSNPILIYKDKKKIFDGQHRLLAAKYDKCTDIEAIIINDWLDEAKLYELWAKINDCGGNVIQALNALGISFQP